MNQEDILLALQAKLPEHTYSAVLRRAEAIKDDGERLALLKRVLAKREASEAVDSR